MRSYCPDLVSLGRKTIKLRVPTSLILTGWLYSGLFFFGLIYLGFLAGPGFVPNDNLTSFAAQAQTSQKARHSTKSSHTSTASHSTKSSTSSHATGTHRSAQSSHSGRIGHSIANSRRLTISKGSRAARGASTRTSPYGRLGWTAVRLHRGRTAASSHLDRHGSVSGRGRKGQTARAPQDQKANKAEVEDNQMEAQAAAEAPPRLRNYALLANAYALYDQGVNERLKGNYGLSTDKLTEAVKLIDQASSIGRDGRPSTLSSMVFYELGQSAEADGDLAFARDSYVHAVKAKPDYVEAYLKLVNVLATSGKTREALNYLKDGLRESPNDARLNAMLIQLGSFMGDGRNTGEGNDMSVPPRADK